MSHSYVHNCVHIVFSTKGRQPLIKDADAMGRYISGIARNHEIGFLAAGGTSNHMHVLIDLPGTMALAKAVNLIKSNSSKWLNAKSTFSWQQGYAAFGVSASKVASVIAYIRDQERHHRRRDFEEEFLTLLKNHGVTYDPTFVWG
jgi:putative transposase